MRKNAKGLGSIYYHKSAKTYAGQYILNGKKRTIYQRKGENVTDFRRRFNELISQINNGTYIENNNDTLHKIISNYIEQRYIDGYTSPRSYRRNLETLKQLEKVGESYIYKPIKHVTTDDINRSKLEMRKYANSTIQKIWILLHKGFQIATNRRKIPYNIMLDDTMQKPLSNKEKKVVRGLSVQEEKKLRAILRTSNSINAKIALIQLNTGMRIGEVLARNIKDLDFKNKTLSVSNTLTQDENYKAILGEHTKIFDKANSIDKGARVIPLDNETLNIFKDLANNLPINGYFFYNSYDERFIIPEQVSAFLNRINKKHSITEETLGTHRLRHTRITRLQEKGVNLAVIQKLVGHVEGSKITSEVYTDVSIDFIRNEMEKIS